MPQEQAFPKSRAAALKAVELDPGSAQGHAVLADLAFYREWDWPKAEKEYKQALDLDPNDADIHAAYAVFLTATYRPEQGLREMTQGQAADPVSELTNVMSAYLFYLDHQYDQAIAQVRNLQLLPICILQGHEEPDGKDSVSGVWWFHNCCESDCRHHIARFNNPIGLWPHNCSLSLGAEKWPVLLT